MSVEKSVVEVDLLEADEPIKDQKFVCLSFISPENLDPKIRPTSSLRGLKVRGVYSTYEEACAKAKALREQDQIFDVYVGEVGKWLPWDSREHVEEENFAEKQLNDLMRAHKDQQELSRKELEERKQKAINSSGQKKKKSN